MTVTVELSYYPLVEDYSKPVKKFIQKIASENITVEAGKMSTYLMGEYEEVMRILSNSMNDLMKEYPSVFHIKISNSCPVM